MQLRLLCPEGVAFRRQTQPDLPRDRGRGRPLLGVENVCLSATNRRSGFSRCMHHRSFALSFCCFRLDSQAFPVIYQKAASGRGCTSGPGCGGAKR